MQQTDATGKLNVDVWHLQCGKIRKNNQHCPQYTQHNFITLKTVFGTAQLPNP